jgi:hypothetical protein
MPTLVRFGGRPWQQAVEGGINTSWDVGCRESAACGWVAGNSINPYGVLNCRNAELVGQYGNSLHESLKQLIEELCWQMSDSS